jgi:1-acyl-sn-glycerol-3-phosphate acyltransferase
MSATHSFVYACLKPWVKLGARIFFRRLEIVGLENFPEGKPVILIANHQNAMLDPVICCALIPRQLHWLTRADVFKKPLVNRILRNLNMLPVYRERDKVANLAGMNEKTFEVCYERLSQGAIVCLFPEGTHRGKKQLVVPLKKGLARLAMGAFNHCPDLHIVPVGLEYSKFEGYATDLLVVVGKPTPVAEYATLAKGDLTKAIACITNDQRTKLAEVMIDIEDETSYEALVSLKPWIDVLCDESLALSFSVFQKTITSWEKDKEQNVRSVLRFKELSELLKVQPIFTKHGALWYYLGAPILLLLALPYLLVGCAVFGPLYLFIERFVKRNVKDDLFYNSIRVSFWTFLSPVVMLIASAIFSALFSGSFSFFAVLLCITFSGAVSLMAIPVWKKWWGITQWNRCKNSYPQQWKEWCVLHSKWTGFLSELKKT